jgi:hypothetical protein
MAAATGRVEAQSDRLPPRLVGLTISPAAVDVTNASQVVTFALHLQDDLSGVDTTSVNRVSIVLTSPSGNQSTQSAVAVQPGVILDGVLQLFVTFPRYIEPGDWRIATVHLRDNTANTVNLGTAALSAAGFPTTVQV